MAASIEDVRKVEEHIGRIFRAQPQDRAAAIRRLFVEVLDFDRDAGQVPLAGATAGIGIPGAAERIASLDGVHVLWVALAGRRVNKREAAEAARLIERDLGEDLLLVFSNFDQTRGDADQLHLILPDFGTAAMPTLRRMTVERDLPQRTACEQIADIYRAGRGAVKEAVGKAFDVEPVTKRFFEEYRRIFQDAKERVTGFQDDGQRHLFVQTLFNRLLFVHFLSRKGWLTFDGNKKYLTALWRDYKSHPAENNFYRDRLRRLFFEALSNPESQSRNYPDIGKVPFLNGGLFEMTDDDARTDVVIPDECIAEVFERLFDRFNFTVMESTPFDVEVAVDPEMLGKVFEELVTGRNESGSYYTPRNVVSFMCREALKGYLEGCETGLDAEAISAFVDAQRTDGIDIAAARKVAEALSEVTVVDPACGSGAYLLGMMQELVELQSVLFNAGASEKSLHDLKLEIIERNLYGVDGDGFAVNIAMLRLWLSLAIEDEPPIDPLPNLRFKIVCGDSLLGPDPRGLSLDRVTIDQSGLGRLKSEYMHASDGDAKKRLQGEIEAAQEQLRSDLGGTAVPEDVTDWRIEFAEVFANGGFDIAVANPPYIQLQKDGGELGKRYTKCGYETFARTGDIYQLFYERGCQLLKADRGLLAYITSNSWLRAEYGKRTRRYFAQSHTPLRWLDLGKDVFDSAIVDSGVLVLRTGGGGRAPFPAADMERLPKGTAVPPPEELWGEARPEGDMPWSVLSQVEWAVMDKMHARGTPLKDWDIAINYGVKTGLNEAFIIDNETKDALVAEDPRSAEILKPVLRGRDIRRYRADWQGLWLIATFPGLGLSIDDYPAVKGHLLSFGRQRLEQSGQSLPDGTRARKKTANAWFETQDTCAYHAEFQKEKLFWLDLTERGRFAYDASETFCVNSAYMLTGDSLKYLCAVLNSSLVTWFIRNSALSSGMGTARWIRFTVERIPVPHISEAEQRPLVALVDRILAARGRGQEAGTEEWEREIDQLVYGTYDLTKDEIRAVTS